MNTTTPSPADLRDRMVDRLATAGHVHSDRVKAAMLAIERHRFLPAASLQDAYADQSVTIKPSAEKGALPLSCASEPRIVAMMLDQLDPQPGDRVLEIGAGTGYNAALLARLVGPAGEVTTVDIDPDVTTHARAALNASGHDRVSVITADGALGHPDHGPYDRIIVTVGPWDIPPAWYEQLKPGGRLVVPLRWRGQARSISFTRQGDSLSSESMQLCGFIPMLGQEGEQSGPIDPDGHVTLHWDVDQALDPVALTGVLAEPKIERWSGITVGGEDPFDGVWLRLTATDRGTCRIAADRRAIETELCTPAIPTRSPALVRHASLAYLTLRRLQPGQWELGATAHGPIAKELAERLCEQTRAWEQDRAAIPRITAYSAGAVTREPDDGLVVPKRHTRLIITVADRARRGTP